MPGNLSLLSGSLFLNGHKSQAKLKIGSWTLYHQVPVIYPVIYPGTREGIELIINIHF